MTEYKAYKKALMRLGINFNIVNNHDAEYKRQCNAIIAYKFSKSSQEDVFCKFLFIEGSIHSTEIYSDDSLVSKIEYDAKDILSTKINKCKTEFDLYITCLKKFGIVFEIVEYNYNVDNYNVDMKIVYIIQPNDGARIHKLVFKYDKLFEEKTYIKNSLVDEAKYEFYKIICIKTNNENYDDGKINKIINNFIYDDVYFIKVNFAGSTKEYIYKTFDKCEVGDLCVVDSPNNKGYEVVHVVDITSNIEDHRSYEFVVSVINDSEYIRLKELEKFISNKVSNLLIKKKKEICLNEIVNLISKDELKSLRKEIDKHEQQYS